MILIAIIFHKLGHLIPLWISKIKMEELRTQFSWKHIFFELHGVMFDLFLAFTIIITLALTSTEHFLLNENAIYGIKCSELMKEFGFEDGDKIVSINNKKVIRFNDILEKILLETDETIIHVIRDTNNIFIKVSDSDKLNIISSKIFTHFEPLLSPTSTVNNSNPPLIYHESKKSIKESFELFLGYLKMNLDYFSPIKPKYEYGGITQIHNVKGALYLFSSMLIFVGLINLIPLPGLDLGNAIIALVEKIRKKKFNPKHMKIAKISSISVIVMFFIFILFSR